MKKVYANLCSSRGSNEMENLEMQVATNTEQASSEHDQVDDEQPPIPVNRAAKPKNPQTSVSTLDNYSRIFLPSSYILFIAFYFLYYMNHL